jgi:HSP20 family protein
MIRAAARCIPSGHAICTDHLICDDERLLRVQFSLAKKRIRPMATQGRKQGEQATTKNQEPRKQESAVPSVQHRGPLAQPGLYEPLRQIRDEFDRMFDRVLSSWPGGRPLSGWPGLRQAGQASEYWGFDVDETDDSVIVRADAPGFEPGDFNLQVRGNQLVLCGEHKEESKDGGARAWSEREICRSVTPPADVNAEKVDAQYRNGVLTVTLPKTTPTSSRRIAVKG